eukprot:5965589-Pyramimonas_sp.AAC.1
MKTMKLRCIAARNRRMRANFSLAVAKSRKEQANATIPALWANSPMADCSETAHSHERPALP